MVGRKNQVIRSLPPKTWRKMCIYENYIGWKNYPIHVIHKLLQDYTNNNNFTPEPT